MIYRLIIFLVINFAALAVGSIFTGKGVPSEWYINLNKAPWTPPGWSFGLAWTTIMICFSLYLMYLWPIIKVKSVLIFLIALQWILNVGWSPTFFYWHNVLLGFLIISGLTILIGVMLLLYWSELKYKTTLLLPYFIWLLIATSLNGYTLLKN